MKNLDIRNAAKAAGVYQWQIASALGISDGTFCHRLREELGEDEKRQIFKVIDALKNGNPTKEIKMKQPRPQVISKPDNSRKPRKTNTPPFLKLTEASKVTGLSTYYLRSGCRDGSIPCVLSGTTYYVNIPALLRKLDAE